MFGLSPEFSIFSFIISLIAAVSSSYLAKTRGKNPVFWFIIGALFGIYGLIFLHFTSKKKGKPQKGKEDSNTIDVTPKIDPSYRTVFWYYLDPDNTQHGPMSFDALFKKWSDGIIKGTTFVWNENLKTWKQFSDMIKP